MGRMNIHYSFTDDNGSTLTYLNGMLRTKGPVMLTRDATSDLASVLLQSNSQTLVVPRG
jgi:hypothetical protein